MIPDELWALHERLTADWRPALATGGQITLAGEAWRRDEARLYAGLKAAGYMKGDHLSAFQAAIRHRYGVSDPPEDRPKPRKKGKRCRTETAPTSS